MQFAPLFDGRDTHCMTTVV